MSLPDWGDSGIYAPPIGSPTLGAAPAADGLRSPSKGAPSRRFDHVQVHGPGCAKGGDVLHRMKVSPSLPTARAFSAAKSLTHRRVIRPPRSSHKVRTSAGSKATQQIGHLCRPKRCSSQTVGFHLPEMVSASLSPGHGGIVTATAARGSSGMALN